MRWSTPGKHVAFTGVPATVRRVAGRFYAWDGYITGKYPTLVPERKISAGWAHAMAHRLPAVIDRFHVRSDQQRHASSNGPVARPEFSGAELSPGVEGLLLESLEGLFRGESQSIPAGGRKRRCPRLTGLIRPAVFRAR